MRRGVSEIGQVGEMQILDILIQYQYGKIQGGWRVSTLEKLIKVQGVAVGGHGSKESNSSIT